MAEKTKKKLCEEALLRLRAFAEKQGDEEAKKDIDILTDFVESDRIHPITHLKG